MRRYALATHIIDVPNQRSSHTVPTPRAGGVGIVVAFTAALLWQSATQGLPAPLTAALAGSGLLVAIVGYMDDRQHLPARTRFAAHVAAAAWSLWCLRGTPMMQLPGLGGDPGWIGVLLAGVYLVWAINLFNFMDGIDGIEAIEAITVAVGGALCWSIARSDAGWSVPLLFACSVAGFLAWNYPPAKIFMGDVGSGFVGAVIGILSLWAGQQDGRLYWCWLILIGCFMVDATTTLLRRVWRGERFHEAHRSHAYQQASRVHRSHRTVALAFGMINLLWLLPLAAAVASGRLNGILGTVIAYVPLIVLAYRYDAGDRIAQETRPT
ncbi:MAG: glycosyltransferase family 4 protein [Piscinibacter sp.]|nr:glycosyltransferase family 4 protein [Piscinibacter sp.]